MTASQISFASFAASLLASVQDEPADCTPPVDETAPVVVAHPVAVDGGECIPFAGVWSVHRFASGLADHAFFADLSPEWACGGLDAPRDPPIGSHASQVIGGRVYADGFDCRVGL